MRLEVSVSGVKEKAALPYISAEQLLNLLGDGVIDVNREGQISFINPSAAKLLGIDAQQAAGLQLSDLFRVQQQPLDTAFIRQCMSRGEPAGPFTQQEVRVTDGRSLLVDFTIIPLDGDHAVLVIHDLSHARQHPHSLVHQVNYDPLTNLPNRDTIQHTLSQLHEWHQGNGKPYTILLLDLDRFKLINDSYGHSSGDLLLQHIASQLKSLVKTREHIGRWGGEEFLCILAETDFEAGLKIAEQLRKKIASFSINIRQQDIFTTTSIGVAGFPRDGEDVADVLKVADAALFEAKRRGRNSVSSSRDKGETFLSTATLLGNALREHRILPAYQPIFDLQSGQQVADEALARIIDPEGGEPMPAGRFIDAAVHLQLVHHIDFEIARQAILNCSQSVLQGQDPHPHFVNISAELLRHPELVQGILDTALQQCQVCGDIIGEEKPLVIEITEQALLHNIEKSRRILAPFIDFGLRLAIDDFGVGYSSLNYLVDLPVSFLKIDGSLVQRADSEKKIRSIIKGIQGIADDLGLITVGEFVETPETVEVLRDLGVQWGQGYYFGKPRILHERFDI